MTKPLVFVSHSSRDKVFLTRLKDLLLRKCRGTFDVFLSCDGMSIPFGSKWVEEVESALRRARLMFVFLSPNALESRWIFFEAGYAHGQGIPVVPVGIFGVEFDRLPQPLGFLQGFTFAGARDLPQAVAAINSTLGLAHELTFTDAEYCHLLGSDAPPGSQPGQAVTSPPSPARSGSYRVYKETRSGDLAFETLTVRIEGPRTTVRSPEWESVGRLERNRFVGRFKYDRGSAPTDLGIHDLTWDGNEFRGCCRFDNGEWEASDLIWRPTDPQS